MQLFYPKQLVEIAPSGSGAKFLAQASVLAVWDNRLLLHAIDTRNLPLPYDFTSPVELYVVKTDAIYVVPGTVIDKKVDPVPVCVVKTDPEAVKRIQRRRYFRVHARLGLELTFPGKGESADSVSTERTQTLNLSAGGVYCSSETDSALDDPVYVVLELPDNLQPLEIAGAIKRIQLRPATKKLIAIEFADIRDCDRGRLFRYLIRVQRKNEHLDVKA